eukprot:gene18270-28162_t
MAKLHKYAATVQQEKYLMLENSFADHQVLTAGDGSVQTGFSVGRRIRFREGHALDLNACKLAIAKVLQRSPVLQCRLEKKAKDAVFPPPPCELLVPPYSSEYCLVRSDWEPPMVDRFIFFQTVDESCADLRVPCTEWLLKPFRLNEQGCELIRFVVLRRGPRVEEILIVGHRSIVDAWSVEWIVQEWVQTYEQLLTPQGSQLMSLVEQLVTSESAGTHASSFFENPTESDSFRDAVSFWATNLEAAMPVVQVPTDRPRPQRISMKQARHSHVLHGSSAAAKNLRRLGVHYEFGVHNVLISVFVAWLSRMTAEKDIVIGLLTNLRKDGYESSVGPLTNRIPLRTDLTAADDAAANRLSFREVAQRVSESLHSVMQHRHIEFEQVIESPLMLDTLKGTKTTLLGGSMQDQDPDALSPLFRVMYMMDSQLTPPLKRDVTWSTVKSLEVVGYALAPYDLTLRVNLRWDGGMEFVFLYNAQLFTKPFVAELMNTYVHLLQQVVDKPTCGIYDYTLITNHSKSILPDPNAPQDGGWPGALVHVFTKNAMRHPNQLAVAYEQGLNMTYQELDESTSQFAHHLVDSGVVKGDVIGIYGYRSPAVVIAIIGIYKAGAAYSMMDPQYPGERVVTCMKIAGIKGWVRIAEAPKEPADVDEYLTTIKPKVRLSLPQPKSGEFASMFSKYPVGSPNVEILPDDTAVVTFTSGSTGTPKGVMGRQSSLTTFYPWMGTTFEITADDRFGMCSGIAHDPLQRDIFTPLFFGASIYIPTQDTINTPGSLGRYMRATGITVCCFTPALGQILVTVDEADFTMEKLRFVMFVGDMLIKRDVLRLRGLAPNCRIINMWGTTETSRAVGYFDIPAPAQGGTDAFIDSLKEVVPCGKGMKDCQMLLLNPAGHPAGVGEAAEIFMRSPHLAKGYLGLPEETRLSRHPCAKENVTVVRNDSKGEKIIVSYVVPTPEALEKAQASDQAKRDLSSSFRDFLKAKVPHYMVPTAVVILNQMPLTPNAKVNTRALPDPQLGVVAEDVVIPGLTPDEAKMLSIWKKHLAHAPRSRDDSFFDLGGHSLSATTVTMEVNKHFGVKLPLNALFSTPTLSGVALAVQSCKDGTTTTQTKRDFMFEAQLPSDIARPPTADEPPAKPRGVFITGTPGFLATYIVLELLKKTDGPIYCLVFSSETTPDAVAYGRNRVIKMLKATVEWKDEYEGRVHPCLGDLQKPKLGLSSERWDEIVDRVDLVVHSGAIVHWLFTYERMKPANVDGTVEVLRLCCSGDRLKTLAFISTTNVYEAEYEKYDIIKEDVELVTGTGLHGGYTQSKWVADKMVMDAAKKRGIPAMSLRPSFISGSAKTGAWTTDDFLVRLIKGCVQLKAYPSIARAKGIDMSPVDWMAAATVAVCMTPECRGKHFNLVNARPVPYAAVFDIVRTEGYVMEELPYAEWRARLLAVVESGEENALSAIVSHFTEEWADTLRTSQVHDKSQLVKYCADSPDCAFPDVETAIKQSLCYFVQSKFMEPPPGGLKITSNVPWEALFKSGEVQLITRERKLAHSTVKPRKVLFL